MRQCRQCPFVGEDNDFAEKSKRKLTGTCRPCHAKYTREWYERNKEKHTTNALANQKRYSEERKLGLRPKHKWSKESRKAWLLKALEEGLCVTCGQASTEHRTCVLCRQKRNAKQKSLRKEPSYVPTAILQDSKESDRRKDRANDLTIEFIRALIEPGCSYCGETSLRMTLDRIDNELGHVQANVVAACIRCNYARGNMPYEAWLCLVPGLREARSKGLFGAWEGRINHSRRP